MLSVSDPIFRRLLSNRINFRPSLWCGVLTSVCVLFAAGSLYSQTTPSSTTLTLDDCIRLALKAPSQLALARRDLQIAGYGIVQARSAFLPQLQINSGYTYNSPLANAYDPVTNTTAGTFIALNGNREYQTIGQSTLEIDTSGRLRAAYARARADQRAAGASVDIAQRDLRRQVVASYYRLLLARHLVSANEANVVEAGGFAQQTRQRFEGGEVAQADVIRAESQLAFLRQALAASQLEAKLANHNLASYWTDAVDDELKIDDTLLHPPQPPDTTTATGSPFLRRPEFALFGAQRQGFEADIRAARSQLFPQLIVSNQYGIDAAHYTAANRGYATTLGFTIPIFDWFRARALGQEARLRAEQVDVNREINTRAFSREYQDALAQVRFIYQQIGLTEAQVKTSEDNLRLSRIRYEGGEGPSLEVVTAQQQLAQARSNYFTALAAYSNARADLEVASGR